MSNKNKVDKDKEKAEWQLALDLQEKKLLEGIKEACNAIIENMKSFLKVELNEIKNEIGDLKKEIQEVSKPPQHLEVKHEKEIQILKDQNKAMQASITTLECKALDNFLRLRGVVEEKGENVFDVMTAMFVEYLEEKTEEIVYNTVYRVTQTMPHKITYLQT